MGLPFKDISYAQGEYDMDADGDQIIAMKASGFYTVSKQPYLDAQLTRNYANAIRLGKQPVLYHYCGGADPTVEASYFISAVSPLADGDVYVLDYEFDVADPVNWVDTFMTHVHAVTGAWPLLYIDISRLNAHDWSPVLQNCGLWLAAPSYGFDQNAPVNNVYVAQQGPIVNGVDSDMWFGTLEELKTYGYKTPTPPNEPVELPPTPEPSPTPNTTPPPPAEVAPAPAPSVPETPVVETVTLPTTATTTVATPTAVVVATKKESLFERLKALLKLIFIGRK